MSSAGEGTRGIFLTPQVGIDPELKIVRGALEGSWYVTTDERKAGAYMDRYRSRFGLEAGIGFTNGYDIAVLMSTAVQSSNAVDFLRTLRDFPGAVGNYGMGDDGGFDLPAWIREVAPGGLHWKND